MLIIAALEKTTIVLSVIVGSRRPILHRPPRIPPYWMHKTPKNAVTVKVIATPKDSPYLSYISGRSWGTRRMAWAPDPAQSAHVTRGPLGA